MPIEKLYIFNIYIIFNWDIIKKTYVSNSQSFMILGFILVFKFFATFFFKLFWVFSYILILLKSHISKLYSIYSIILNIFNYIQHFNILIKHNFWF